MKPSMFLNKMSAVSFCCDGLIPIALLLEIFYVTFQFFCRWLGTKPFVPIIFIKARGLRDRGSETKNHFFAK